ncbi:BCCT family transporter [Paracoccus fistulariae]|uniref:BCCT family transporter n=1 Tax=Paracoccus fistulariae TaxID=658446 RepID=A0ABY7SLU8_9RHOB|nr:BCCT family transporter [Paracoccus fistulariae]MDB6182573.1 BCCT family transporter [Paracoccus fistulariae]WCR07781.1 BCCT family transporter [Paracoccus fistulariae]
MTSIKPPVTDLDIPTEEKGFYEGFSKAVTLGSKALIGILIVWAIAVPENAGAVLSGIRSTIDANTGSWYMYAMAFYLIVSIALAALPATGRIRLGGAESRPEFSAFSWISMMIGAGTGIGMLTYSSAEPLFHLASNPEVIMGEATAMAADNVRNAMKWSFFHWGLSAWGCYAMIGLALAFFAYVRGLPLTIRSALTPLFGRSLEGPLGHLFDILSVIATVLGVAVTLGYGVSQFAAGVHNITGMGWLMNDEGTPTVTAMLVALLIVMGLSTVSALSGVGKGIKWLSNINMGLSFFVLAFLLIFGSTIFALKSLFLGIWDYVIAMPGMVTTIWRPDGVEGSVATQLAEWQGAWTIFYWAWWIAFAPFVGLFLARISRGRTIREYVLGAMIVPTIIHCVWFSFAGGTAIDLTLNGGAGDQITGAGISSQLFEIINYLLTPVLAKMMSALIVVLLLTYLVTSADSAVLIVNTISAAGDESPKGRIHILTWGAIFTLVIGGLLVAGGLDAINTAMIIGALPFSVVMVLMGVSLIKALIRDGMRRRRGEAVKPELAE